jgi:hypothetical protein
MGSVGLTNANQITLSATPLITANEVYDAYLEFLKDDESLLVTSEPPPPGAAHICRKCDKLYYWVPVTHARKFRSLALATTAQRGKKTTVDDVISVNVSAVVDTKGSDTPDKKLVSITLDQMIKNDAGSMTIQGVNGALPFDKYAVMQDGNLVEPPETAVILLFVSEAQFEALKVVPKAAKIWLEHQRPPPNPADDLIKQTNSLLLQLNQNIVRQGT